MEAAAVRRITVAVPTFRRNESLAALLSGLAALDDPGIEWDVLVVDNDDAPGAEPIVSAAIPTFPVPLRLAREAKRGAAYARNRAIAEAAGDVVAFIDDDVVPDVRWLVQLVAPMLAGRCDGVAGRVVLAPDVPRPAWFDDHYLSGYLSEFDLGASEMPMRPDAWLLTANAAFRTERLRECGGFDPRLGPRNGTPLVNDDAQVAQAFMRAGGRIHYVPSAVVVHELPATRLSPRYLLRRAHAQGRSDWLLHRGGPPGRRYGGVGWCLGDLRRKLARHARRAPSRAVLLDAACDTARAAGWFRELLVGASAGR